MPFIQGRVAINLPSLDLINNVFKEKEYKIILGLKNQNAITTYISNTQSCTFLGIQQQNNNVSGLQGFKLKFKFLLRQPQLSLLNAYNNIIATGGLPQSILYSYINFYKIVQVSNNSFKVLFETYNIPQVQKFKVYNGGINLFYSDISFIPKII